MKFTQGCLSSLKSDTQLYTENQVMVHDDDKAYNPATMARTFRRPGVGYSEIIPEDALVAAHIDSCDLIK